MLFVFTCFMCFQDAESDEGQDDDTDEVEDDEGGSKWEYEEGSESDDDSE